MARKPTAKGRDSRLERKKNTRDMREDQKQTREIYRQSGKKRNRLTKNGPIKLSDHNLRNAVTAPFFFASKKKKKINDGVPHFMTALND